ncbi:hypothetical protein BDD26_1045 [Xenorhabdus cabanillasii]|uniref:Uncharacterized protein n=1 Tax=Xenorhabdus cabanillasii TaxID=351673 RepID=A0A3D9UAH5_9GAMM|nr:hypothetical protein [Xenorhabdus cabanillasii]REF26409.1 hypothetical protein BDD26_1045 [Xenorhabdus cabanillasii]
MIVGSTVVMKNDLKKKEMTVIEVNGDSAVCGWHENKRFHKEIIPQKELIVISPPGLISSIF